MERNDLIERLMEDVFPFVEDHIPVQVSSGVLREAAATIERLTAEKEEAERKGAEAGFRWRYEGSLRWSFARELKSVPYGPDVECDRLVAVERVARPFPPRALSQGGEHE